MAVEREHLGEAPQGEDPNTWTLNNYKLTSEELFGLNPSVGKTIDRIYDDVFARTVDVYSLTGEIKARFEQYQIMHIAYWDDVVRPIIQGVYGVPVDFETSEKYPDQIEANKVYLDHLKETPMFEEVSTAYTTNLTEVNFNNRLVLVEIVKYLLRHDMLSEEIQQDLTRNGMLLDKLIQTYQGKLLVREKLSSAHEEFIGAYAQLVIPGCENEAVLGNYQQKNVQFPSAPIARHKASVFFRQGKFNQALEQYDEAIKRNTEDTTASKRKNNLLTVIAELEEYDQAIMSNPKNPIPYVQKAALLIKLGQYEEAIKTYDKYIPLMKIDDPDLPDFLNARADTLLRLRKHQEALVAFQDLTRTFPDYPIAIIGMAETLQELSRYEEAKTMFEEILPLIENQKYVTYIQEHISYISDVLRLQESQIK